MNPNYRNSIPSIPAQQLFRRILAIALLLSATLPIKAATADNSALWRPRFATPAIVALDSAANREFTAEVRGSSSAKKWKATLVNDLRSWPCRIVSATYAKINRDTE